MLQRCRRGLEAFFHQLFAHPVNHGWAGFQSFDDPLVAPPFASFRDIGLQQDPRLQYPARRALSFPIRVSSRSRSSPLSRTTYFFTEISFAAMIASLASRWRRKRITKSFELGEAGG